MYNFLSAYYSLSQGVSTAASVGYSVYNSTEDPELSGSVALAALVADSIASYYFQGASIRRAGMAYPNHGDYELINDDNQPRRTVCTSAASIGAQMAYASLDIGKNFANRYFLLLVIFNLFALDPASPVFWVMLVLDMLLKESFNLTNEAYEVEEEIAKKIEGKEAKPFYRNIFSPLAHSQKAVTFFKIVGCVEHVVVDDLAPWLALFPPEAAKYLMQHTGVKTAVIAVATSIGIPLALLIFLQTFLFEGEHTETHLKEIHNELQNTTRWHLPQKLAALLKTTINIMGPIHGMATAAPIQITLRELIANPDIKWPVSIVAGLIAFCGTAIGVHLSEVREAKEILENLSSSDSDEKNQNFGL